MSSPPQVEVGKLWPLTVVPASPEAQQAERQRVEIFVLQAVQAQPWLVWLIAALGAWVLSSLVMWLSRFPGQVASLWYMNVWGVALLLPVPRRQWPGLLLAIAIGNLAANLAYGDSLLAALSYLPPNLVETLAGVTLLRGSEAYRRMSFSPIDGLTVLLRGSLLPSLAGAAVAMLVFGWQDDGPLMRIGLNWFESTLVGSATLLPLVLAVLASERGAIQREFAAPRAWAFALLSVGVGVFCLLQLPFPFVYIALPLALAAVQVRFVVVAALVWLMAMVVVTLIAQGLFVPPPQTAYWQQLLLYAPLLAALWPPLLLAAAMEQARHQNDEISRSRERFRRLYERTPAMMVSTDPEGRLLSVSRLWLERMGLRREDVIGRKLVDFLAADSRRRAVTRTWPDLLATGRCRDVEYRLMRSDGQRIDVLLSATTERDADGCITRTHAVLEDITRKRLAEELEAEHERSKVTLESIADAVITSDPQGRILYLNPVAVTMIGLPEEQVRGRLYGEVLRRRDVETGAELPDPVALCLHQRKRLALPQRVRLGHAHGSEHVVQESVSPMFAAGGVLIGAVAVMQDVTEAHTLALELAHRAQHDVLTGLPNRLLLHDRLQQGLQLARRNRTVLALMFMDLDRFKAVNDSHGHAVGDELLCQVANRLLKQLRATDTACRLGGDEFVVLLSQVEQASDAGDVAAHLLEALSKPYQLGRHQADISASIGIACFPQDGDDEATLMRNADAAMYQAKQQGRNRVVFFKRPD
jgi:diguanylate cyclase (GGDEF)-like protein/PAS domain S-box-containing protein